MDKAARMQEIEAEIRELTSSPLYDYRAENDYKPVIGEGALDARIMFIGEAPGAREAKTGRPFVGNAGQVLDDLLASIGVTREDVYITNVVKDRPPNNRDPHVEEIELYAPFLQRQIDIIQPQVIATLGRFAMDFVLDLFDMPEAGARISDLHGQILEAQRDDEDLVLVPLYHPAAAFYNQDLASTMEEDFQRLEPFVKDR